MNFEYKKPHTRLTHENTNNVMTGGTCNLSEYAPIMMAIIPMKITYMMYLIVVASALNVHLAFAKKENVTAVQNAMKLESA